MNVVTVNRIRAAKKLVLYFRFLETAARQVSECKGVFEQLPESSQTSSVNLAFAGDYLDIKEIREFGAKIKEYFKFSPMFYTVFSSHSMVDPELKTHCEAVKHQKVPPKELAEYYISYMDRMDKEADPKVKEKLKKGQYPDKIVLPQPMNGFGGFPGQPGPGFPGQPPNNGGFPGFPNGPTNPPGGHSFGGGGNYGAGFGGHPGTVYSNPFTGPTGYQNGFQMNANTQVANPFIQAQAYDNGQKYLDHAKPNPFQTSPAPTAYTPPMGEINFQNQKVQSSFGEKPDFDDIFSDPKTNTKNVGFGGEKKPAGYPNTGDPATDDFLKQLEDLKKL